MMIPQMMFPGMMNPMMQSMMMNQPAADQSSSDSEDDRGRRRKQRRTGSHPRHGSEQQVASSSGPPDSHRELEEDSSLALVEDEQFATTTPGPENGRKFTPDMLKEISRSHGCIKSLGRARLSQAIEFLVPALDSTMTADLSSDGLLMILWLLTRIKPSVVISSLRFLVVVLNLCNRTPTCHCFSS